MPPTTPTPSSAPPLAAVAVGAADAAGEADATPLGAAPEPSSRRHAVRVLPGQFEPTRHWYPRALNAQIHPLVAYFMNLSAERVFERYCHLNPHVDRAALESVLTNVPQHFRWAGCDLFHVTSEVGQRQMVLIETNSCPSGQKSMPLLNDAQEQGGYRTLIEQTFVPMLAGKRLPTGGLAVVYDKNLMGSSGYAAAMADAMGEPVFFVEHRRGDPDPPVRYSDGVMEVRESDGAWLPIRAAFRYVTQRPWDRVPLHTKTLILNPVLVCLAGGRNKMVAAKAYDLFNADLDGTGLAIRVPETMWDIDKQEVPLWVKRLGGHAVVKVPYSNAGQGVYTITNQRELDAFMDEPHDYTQFIVQSLVGNYHWSSRTRAGRLYHVGTVPNRKGEIFVADLRMMVHATDAGLRPIALYARRAATPLIPALPAAADSWEMLGTNLSIKRHDGGWDSDVDRLMLVDRKDFNQLGLGLDNLIEAYIQTVLATVAIDRMASTLLTQKGRFRMKLFQSLDADETLIQEILL